MGYRVLADKAISEAGWLEAREGLITATDIGKIMTGGAGVWAELKRSKLHGSGFSGNQFTRWGNEREPHIVGFIERKYGLVANSALLGHVDYPKYAATPDAVSRDGALVGEVKTTVRDWPTVADIPARYWWQMQWQMFVTGAKLTVFAFEVHENFVPAQFEPSVFLVERDDAAITEALARAAEFEAFTSGGVDAPAGLGEQLRELADLEDAAAALTEKAATLRAEMKASLVKFGKPVKFDIGDRSLSWSGKPVARKHVDQAALKAAHPDIIAAFTTVKEQEPQLTIRRKERE